MRISWWQSIRWRLALGSILVALLATGLLTLLMILAIPYYYGIDQRTQLTNFATESSQRIGGEYAQSGTLVKAVQNTLPAVLNSTAGGDSYLLVVVNRANQIIYPSFPVRRAVLQKVQQIIQQALFTKLLGAAVDPNLQAGDYLKIGQAVKNGQQGIATVSEVGVSGPATTPHLFAVQPILNGNQSNSKVVGVLVVFPRSTAENTVPSFLGVVRNSILGVSIIVAIIAVLAAIFFSRTITRPLARLTNAARVLATGNYAARVTTSAGGELGELADTFNKMAARLESDVNELQRQELWRRELIMNITHDLATPLTAIAGLGDSLLDGVNQTHEDYEATGRIIVRETLRLRRLVKDLHTMTKVEAGALSLQLKQVRLAAIVDEALAVLTPEFERANVEPYNNVAYDLPPVQADPDMLMRVFSNLCDNAIRHTPSGGRVRIDAEQRGNMLEVSVNDSGEGIPAEALPLVFNRFYRADNSRQVATGGSGLGLAIVHAIIEAHGGSVRAENAPEGGARIIFTLPMKAPAPTLVYDAATKPLH